MELTASHAAAVICGYRSLHRRCPLPLFRKQDAIPPNFAALQRDSVCDMRDHFLVRVYENRLEYTHELSVLSC